MQLASTTAVATPLTPSQAFVSQLRGPSNPTGGDASSNYDCGVAASLMAMWVTGAQARPTTGTGIAQAFESTRLLATGNADHSRSLFPKDLERLFTKTHVAHAAEVSSAQLLDDVRRGATAVVIGSGTGAFGRDHGDLHGTGTWYERTPELGLPGVPDGHAITVTDYRASDDSVVVMDPLAQVPFRAPTREVSNFIDKNAPWGYPAGFTVAAKQ